MLLLLLLALKGFDFCCTGFGLGRLLDFFVFDAFDPLIPDVLLDRLCAGFPTPPLVLRAIFEDCSGWLGFPENVEISWIHS